MSRKDLKQSVTVDLEGNLPQRSQAFERALQRMGQRGQQHLSGMARMASAAGRGLDMIGNRYTGLISGAAVALAVKQVGDLQERYTRLGITADITDEQLARMKAQIYEISQAPDIRVDPAEILSAIESIVEKTGDLEFAQANIRNIGMAIQATGATGQNVGEMLAEFQKQGITAPRAVLETIDVLNEQGKAGAFTLQNLASLGPRVVAAYNAVGRAGPQAMREMGAALQVIRMGTGSSEQAATAFEAVMRTMSDPQKLKKLQELSGISVFDPEALKAGRQQLKPINELMVEIIQAAGGKATNLAQIFDAEAMRAFNAASAEFQRNGTINSLERFMQVSGDGTTTIRDSARAAGTFNAAMVSLKTAWDEFADENLTGPVSDLADLLNAADRETVQLTMSTAKWGAAVLGVAIAGRKAFQLYKGASALLGRGGLAGGSGALSGASGALSSMKPVPVVVVNGGGMPAGAATAARGGRWLSRLGMAGRAAPWVAGAAGAVELYGSYTDASKTTAQKVDDTVEVAGGLAGAIAGAKGGAIAGAFLGPVGAAVGGLIGSVGGYMLGRWGGDALGDLATGNNRLAASGRTEREQQATVRLEVTSATPVKVREMRATGLDIDVDAGPVMGP